MDRSLPDRAGEPIPTALEELTPAFLTGALRRAGVLADGRVTACKAEPIGEGHGFACQVVRLQICYDDGHDSGPATLIAKLPTTVRWNRASVEASRGYEREVCFYRELADRSLLTVPLCYYAELDGDPYDPRRAALFRALERAPTWLLRMLIPLGRWGAALNRQRSLVLLEDLAPARSGDQIAGGGSREAEQAIRGLAAFHASYWSDETLAARIWLPAVDDLPRAFRAIYRHTRRRFFRQYGGMLPPHLFDACRWMDAHCEEATARLGSPPFTLMHGDYRLDNLFFDGDRMWAGDFQGVARSRPGLDLAYFVVGSVDPSVDEDRLLDDYCDELAARGVRGYPRSECGRDYALGKLFQAYMLPATDESFLDLGEGRGRQLLEVMRKRLLSRIPEPPYDGLLEPNGPDRGDVSYTDVR